MIPAYVINLKRRPDRLAFMSAQLEAQNIAWTRVEALDTRQARDQDLRPFVALSGHRIRMEHGSQCAAATVLGLFRRILQDGHEAALILEDDVTLSPDIVHLLGDTRWIPEGIGLIQFEKYGRRVSRRLAMPGQVTPAKGRMLHRLKSRTGGGACYVITRRAIEIILSDFKPLDVPLDHFLFSPNVGRHFDRLGVAIIAPALARQNNPHLESDIRASRRAEPKTASERLRRAYLEANRLPGQLWALARGARVVTYDFRMDVTGDE